MTKNYCIIGASAAGMAAATKLRQLDAHASITLFSYERELPYNKCFLADYIGGSKERSALFLRSESFFQTHTVDITLATRISALYPQQQCIETDKGNRISYDQLLIATGVEPFVPSLFKEVGAAGVFVFYRYGDTEALLSFARVHHTRTVLVIGAGLCGLECADALAKKGMKATVVECASYVMHTQITQEGAAHLHTAMKEKGIHFLSSMTVTEIIHDGKRVTGVLLSDGSLHLTDMIVCAMGARFDARMYEAAGIACSPQGIIVNKQLQTSLPGVYAAGDCICITDLLTGTHMRSCMWPDAMQQGTIAATNMIAAASGGAFRSYEGASVIISSSFFGQKIAATSGFSSLEKTYKTFIKEKRSDYYQHIIGDNAGIIKGFLLIGNTPLKPADLKRLLLTQEPFLF